MDASTQAAFQAQREQTLDLSAEKELLISRVDKLEVENASLRRRLNAKELVHTERHHHDQRPACLSCTQLQALVDELELANEDLELRVRQLQRDNTNLTKRLEAVERERLSENQTATLMLKYAQLTFDLQAAAAHYFESAGIDDSPLDKIR